MSREEMSDVQQAPVALSEEERAAWDSWLEAQTDNDGIVDLVRRSSAYLAGWRSRDAELSALRSQLEALREAALLYDASVREMQKQGGIPDAVDQAILTERRAALASLLEKGTDHA